jgi:hypothetical protein
MTVRIDQLVFTGDDRGYLGNPPNKQGIAEEEVLSLVRNIMRERSDCQIVPEVNEVFRTAEPNEYGDNIFIDVTYDRSGFRATYGAHFDTFTQRIKVQCYMD